MRTLSREVISTRQEKLAELAQIEPRLELTTLAHHIDEVWLREAYRRTRKEMTAAAHEIHECDVEGVKLELLTESETPPFVVEDGADA